jgi:hypothetical protein
MILPIFSQKDYTLIKSAEIVDYEQGNIKVKLAQLDPEWHATLLPVSLDDKPNGVLIYVPGVTVKELLKKGVKKNG